MGGGGADDLPFILQQEAYTIAKEQTGQQGQDKTEIRTEKEFIAHFNQKSKKESINTSINESELKLMRLQLGISLLLTNIGHFPMFLI